MQSVALHRACYFLSGGICFPLAYGLTNALPAAHNIHAQNRNRLPALGEKKLRAGEIPTPQELEAMNLSESETLGTMVLFQMEAPEDFESSNFEQAPSMVTPQFASSSFSQSHTDKINWGIHHIDACLDGKGFWGRRIRQSNLRVDSYELKINPRNESYYLPHPDGGFVQFENMVNATVQDGKLIIRQKSFYHIYDMPSFAKKRVLKEASRQLSAAQAADYKVEWLVSDVRATEQLKSLFKEQSMDITVTHFPE